jgi:hypothetical protein
VVAIDASLLLSLFRSIPDQRPTYPGLLARPEAAEAPFLEPRVGVLVDGDRLSDSLAIQTIVHSLGAEPGITQVSTVERASSAHVAQFVRANDLDRLVVGGQYIDSVARASAGVIGRNGNGTSRVRVVDLGRLCARVHGGEDATAKAVLLLLAAVARVRSGNVLSRASVDDELQALLNSNHLDLSPRVAILACPAAFASLRMVGQIGKQYQAGALPVEVPCHLNMDRSLTARACELGAAAVLTMGCSSGCELGRELPNGQAKAPESKFRPCSNGEDQPLESVTVTRLRDLVDGLDKFLTKV